MKNSICIDESGRSDKLVSGTLDTIPLETRLVSFDICLASRGDGEKRLPDWVRAAGSEGIFEQSAANCPACPSRIYSSLKIYISEGASGLGHVDKGVGKNGSSRGH